MEFSEKESSLRSMGSLYLHGLLTGAVGVVLFLGAAFVSLLVSLEHEELCTVLRDVLTGDLLPRQPRAVGLLGHSRGGGQAVLGAAAEGGVTALVTWAAVSHFDRWSDERKAQWRQDGEVLVLNQRTGQQMPLGVGLLEDYEANRDRLDIARAAGEIRAPWLIVHGRADETVPSTEADELARASTGARIELIDGAGHTFECRHPFEGATPQLNAALDRTISHFRTHLET